MKLSDTQLILLSKAAKRDDQAVQLPANMNAIVAERLVSRLAGAGLIEEIEASGTLPIWRRLDDVAFTLRMTGAGLKAIGVDGTVDNNGEKKPAGKKSAQSNVSVKSHRSAKKRSSSNISKLKPSKKPKKTHETAARRSDTKHDQILNLLRRKQGASLEELQKASGWQAHSVRGFLSGTVKKKLGVKLRSSVTKNGERRYMIAAS